MTATHDVDDVGAPDDVLDTARSTGDADGGARHPDGTDPTDGTSSSDPDDAAPLRSAGLLTFARRHGWHVIAAATSLVIAFAAGRGIVRGYQPVGDNALIALRSRDVLTGAHPFIGAWSSASLGAGIDVNHPGPLLYGVLALPVKVFGDAVGVPLAVAALQIAVVWAVGAVTSRTGGATAAITATSFTAFLVWVLGSELLYDPWQPNVLVLPFWLVLCSAWAVAAGRVEMLPLVVGVGTFAMQTHLSYVTVVPVVVAAALVTAGLRLRRDDRLVELRRPTVLSVGVLLVLWAQPLWEQFTGAGQGNLSRMATVATGGGDDPDVARIESFSPGAGLAVRIVGSVLAVPPFWGRSGFDSTVEGDYVDTPDGPELVTPELASTPVAIVALLVAIGVAVSVAVAARRAGAHRVVAGFVVLAAAVLVALVSTLATPVDTLGLSPHKVRWLWVVGSFGTWLVVLGLLAIVDRRRRSIGVAALATVAFVALVATLPTHRHVAGPAVQEEVWARVETVRAELDRRLDDGDIGPVVFDPGFLGFAEPYTAPVKAELLENGVDLVVEPDSLARQLGPRRDGDPSDPDFAERGVVTVRLGPDALTVPPDEELLAFADDPPPGVERSADDPRWAVGVFLRPARDPADEPVESIEPLEPAGSMP